MAKHSETETVTLTLPYYEARALRSAATAAAKRAQRRADKGGFEPEEGRVDVNRAQAAVLGRAVDKLDEALGAEPPYKPKPYGSFASLPTD